MEKGIVKDDQNRGWEIKYAFYVDDTDYPEETDVRQFMDNFFVKLFGRYCKNIPEIVDWDGPL